MPGSKPPPQQYEATDATASSATTIAERYRPERERSGTALCLSGGGFRATLFHLGALRRLNETGVLAKLDTVSSVSGGSIMAAMLATRAPWPVSAPIPSDIWERDIAAPVRAFASRNIRMPAILGRWLRPWNTSAGVRGLLTRYAAGVSPAKLAALPERPRFVFCATDLYHGVNFVFERGRVGDFKLGYLSPPPAEWDVARAVAASSCFPPVFNPLPLDIPIASFKRGRGETPADADVRLNDGGLYDNLGLEPVWKDHATVLVSDGGAVFDSATDMDGAYWGIGSATGSYPEGGPGYSKALATQVIASVRTDLDAFSPAETAVLENHGYALAAAAITTHLGALATPGAPAATAPHPEWTDEDRVRAALADSWKRKLLGRW